MPTAQDGWSRLGYNVGAWNTTPDALANVTGQQLETQIDFGGYWNADEWSSGAWNIGHGAVLTGTGNVFAISTLTQLTASVGNIITIANAKLQHVTSSVFSMDPYVNLKMSNQNATTTVKLKGGK